MCLVALPHAHARLIALQMIDAGEQRRLLLSNLLQHLTEQLDAPLNDSDTADSEIPVDNYNGTSGLRTATYLRALYEARDIDTLLNTT